MPTCPICGGSAFEHRGEVRRYIALDDALQEDSWTDHPDVDLDEDDRGNPIIYCCECNSAFTDESELKGETSGGNARTGDTQRSS